MPVIHFDLQMIDSECISWHNHLQQIVFGRSLDAPRWSPLGGRTSLNPADARDAGSVCYTYVRLHPVFKTGTALPLSTVLRDPLTV